MNSIKISSNHFLHILLHGLGKSTEKASKLLLLLPPLTVVTTAFLHLGKPASCFRLNPTLRFANFYTSLMLRRFSSLFSLMLGVNRSHWNNGMALGCCRLVSSSYAAVMGFFFRSKSLSLSYVAHYFFDSTTSFFFSGYITNYGISHLEEALERMAVCLNWGLHS